MRSYRPWSSDVEAFDMFFQFEPGGWKQVPVPGRTCTSHASLYPMSRVALAAILSRFGLQRVAQAPPALMADIMCDLSIRPTGDRVASNTVSMIRVDSFVSPKIIRVNQACKNSTDEHPRSQITYDCYHDRLELVLDPGPSSRNFLFVPGLLGSFLNPSSSSSRLRRSGMDLAPEELPSPKLASPCCDANVMMTAG